MAQLHLPPLVALVVASAPRPPPQLLLPLVLLLLLLEALEVDLERKLHPLPLLQADSELRMISQLHHQLLEDLVVQDLVRPLGRRAFVKTMPQRMVGVAEQNRDRWR
jgi:hypothetical protein